jgi:hypothetical protein
MPISKRGSLRISPGKHHRSPKAEEAMLAQVAAQRDHPNPAQYEVENAAVRPANIRLAALWTVNSHGQQSPWNLRFGEVNSSIAIELREMKQAYPGLWPCTGDTSMMLPGQRIRNRADNVL